ncbi:hypothetical protein EJD98_29045 [Mycolicibacterium peregrinum]|uniref:Uncharacterized protein n=1 Tax=Mycolicibacterium peregrinum TaxID=43304 RepID=A0A4Z0HIZ9_MYCPR|nr:hypothetical protein EJD98_29045 [Mycolicibacterium peregrinum]TGB37115.1 hypothetical protein EJD94_27170 [Mycolicibacterium peregrinum]
MRRGVLPVVAARLGVRRRGRCRGGRRRGGLGRRGGRCLGRLRRRGGRGVGRHAELGGHRQAGGGGPGRGGLRGLRSRRIGGWDEIDGSVLGPSGAGQRDHRPQHQADHGEGCSAGPRDGRRRVMPGRLGRLPLIVLVTGHGHRYYARP